jgi:hypothetical protein
MITISSTNGHTVVRMENESLRVGILPGKGADIIELFYKPEGVSFLMRTPQGLKPPTENPPGDFLENYEGGWQELFPNPGDAVVYKGKQLPFHGEAALLPWDYSIERDQDLFSTVRFDLKCRKTPFFLQRWMHLSGDDPVLEMKGKITNLSSERQEFSWGHHIVLGENFLEDGCRVELTEATIVTPEELYEPETALLAPAQSERWPHAQGRRTGETIDLSRIPGPDAQQHDDVYLVDLVVGRVAVVNPRLRLRFVLQWDSQVFGCLVNWRPLGGANLPPLTGIYGLGIEPWTSRYSLADAIEKGVAIPLAAGESMSTSLQVYIEKVC